MGTKVTVSMDKTFNVNASVDETFALLADVPKSASHYPGVESLNDKGGNTFEWVMEEIGAAGFSHQVIYASTYNSDAGTHSINWTPAGGNSDVSGSWTLTADGDGTRCEFRVNADLDVPVPRLLKNMAKPVVEQQFNSQIDTYIKNLQSALA